MKYFLTRGCAAFAAALVTTAGAIAQPFPDRPIRIVVGFGPGGSVDTIARVFAQKLQESLAQPVIVENRPGAGGSLGANAVAKSEPDGYRILLENSGSFDYAVLNKNLPYKVLNDFTPLAYIGSVPRVLVVGPTVQARDVEELLKTARLRPNALSYSSDGSGASTHVGVERLAQIAQAKFLHVPFKGGAEATTAVASGQVDFTLFSVTTTLPLIRAEKVRPLAVSSLTRSKLLPGVPTFTEAGVKGFEQLAWYGFVGPANMNKEAVEKLQSAIDRVINLPDVRELLTRQGLEIGGKNAEQFQSFMREYGKQTTQVARDANIKME